MPKKSVQPSVADELSTPGGAAAVDRAISLLAAFQPGDKSLSVTELAQRTRLYKSTALRLLASLANGGLLVRTSDGRWALGPELVRLAAIHTASFSLEELVLPAMRALVAATQESVAFHVRQGAQRMVLFRVDSPQLLRDHVRAGDVLPLHQGTGGRVLLAFAGEPGDLYEQIRQQGYFEAVGDRVPDLAGASAPVWNARGELVGALTLTAPATRFSSPHTQALREAAWAITHQLGGGKGGLRLLEPARPS